MMIELIIDFDRADESGGEKKKTKQDKTRQKETATNRWHKQYKYSNNENAATFMPLTGMSIRNDE